MLNLLKTEFYKLKTSKMFYLTMFLSLLQVIAVYTFSERFRLMNGKESVLYILNIQSQLALDILMVIFAADFIVTEFTSGYIKNLIAYGHSRISIFISKNAACCTGFIIISFVPPIIMICINTAINGYGEVFTAYSIMFLIRTFSVMAIIYISIGSIGTLMAFLSRNINITIVFVTVIDFINRFFIAMATQKPAVEWIYDKLIYAQPNIVLSGKCTNSELLQAVIISVVIIIFANGIGNHAFNKVDIK